MTDKELIKQEIEKLKSEYNKESISAPLEAIQQEKSLASSFIDSLPEEPASKDWKNTILNSNDIKIMYASRKAGIESFAETYSFNIESVLFNQLTLEQQKLWRKEIENAIISGGEMGLELADDKRYDEIESSEDLENEIERFLDEDENIPSYSKTARHFAEWQKQKSTQDFLEKAEMYLKTRVYYNMHPNNITTAIQDFKNYMQDE